MGSVALHAAVAAALLISWRHPRDLKIGSVVPVTIVSDAPAGDLSPAIQAPETQTAQVAEPIPAAPPEPLPPTPQPTPQPPTPQARPAAAAKPTPTPAKPAAPSPAPAKAERTFDLDALAASVSKMARPASGPKGTLRPQTAPQSGAGSAAAAAALSGLADELQRRWNPNCAVADARQVVVAVTFTLNSGGGVLGEVRGQLVQGAQTPAALTAADRAVSAVYAAAPFRSLPREVYGQPIRVNFDARKACS
jgi:outer membrane biosynthesis protein TonB